MGAIRECFEESGILLARMKDGTGGGLLEVEEEEREKGRKEVHEGKVRFEEWVKEKGGVPDCGAYKISCSIQNTHYLPLILIKL